MIGTFVTTYGYLAVFAGTLLEGETILIAAGFAAHRGLLDWQLVILVAMLGATLGDQLAFLLGRWKGAALIERFPSLARQTPRIHGLMERHDALFILTIRFLYGLRIAGPLILGSSRVSLPRFILFNIIGAALWASLITGLGYTFGFTFSYFIADLKRAEELILILILVAGAMFWLWRWNRARRPRKARYKKVSSQSNDKRNERQ